MRPAKWLPLLSVITIAVLALVSYNWFAHDTSVVKTLVVMFVATVLVAGGPLILGRTSR